MYSNFELDVLKEIGNIGAGNAATALSVIISKKVLIKIPEVLIVPLGEVINMIKNPESFVTGIFFRIEGDLKSNCILIIPEKETKNLLALLLKEEVKDLLGLSEIEKSALMEVGNILVSSFISALSDFTKLNLKISVPSLALDMAAAILSFPLTIYGIMGDTALLLSTEFFGDSDGVVIDFYLIPDDDKSFKKLLKAIGVDFIDDDDTSGNRRI